MSGSLELKSFCGRTLRIKNQLYIGVHVVICQAIAILFTDLFQVVGVERICQLSNFV